MSSAGYPYLQREAWERFRDRIPHLFQRGLAVYRTVEKLEKKIENGGLDEPERDNISKACRVARQVLFTATITAPPDLWLMRHVLGYFDELGLTDRLLKGGAIYPGSCDIAHDGARVRLDADELQRDLHFLLARGLVEQYDNSFRIAGHPRVHTIFAKLGPIPNAVPIPMTPVWRRLFDDGGIDDDDRRAISALGQGLETPDNDRQNHWIPTLREIRTGYRLLPVVLALRAEELNFELDRGDTISPTDWSDDEPELVLQAMRLLEASGWLERVGEDFRVTAIGARGFARGPGPFGIIETYNSYMKHGANLLLGNGDDVWVDRSKNVGASRDANRKTFQRANDNLDRFCEETGFEFSVFIEHAIGHGEATRQRYERSGDEEIDYVGADLEDAAIDAAEAEKKKGTLPPNMTFVRNADIGEPDVLLQALRERGVDSNGAVMMVGNGFHEIRNRDDDNMVGVFQTYHDAGILLLFTEANALLVDDLRATAWNTYHAGFTFVHEKSGQNLRPAERRGKPRLGEKLRASWNECARRAGYVRAHDYCRRSRTIYPYTPDDGHNPSISVNHFFVPRQIADELGLEIAVD